MSSNPPYIRIPNRATLSDEVRLHDPALALFAGDDGLDAYRTILPQAHGKLRSRGYLLVEIGHDQADSVSTLGAAEGFQVLDTRQDLSGNDRVVVFRR